MTDKSEHSEAIAPEIAAMSFEDALAALEEVVRKLEGGQVALEDSIDLYSRGAQLKRHCEAKLRAAQERVEKIVIAGDGESAAGTEPFVVE